jgi:hypothetical protein
MRSFHFLAVFLGALLVLGCDAHKSEAPTVPMGGDEFNENEKFAQDVKGAFGPAGAAGQAGVRGQVPAADAPAKRRVISSGTVDLIVTDFDGAVAQIATLIEQSGGYVARSDLGASTGERRRASWTLRVPVAKYQATLDALARLGHAQSVRTDSQDVTDEYYDLEARLKNKHTEEDRLLEHLKKSTGKLEDILAVERELTRVRGEIELMQGRLNKLTKLSELTTITLTIQERKDYVPPTAPTYSTSLGRTFGASVEALMTLLKWIVMAIVALVPWSPLIALAIGVSWWLIRRSARVPVVTSAESGTPR